MEGEFGNYLDRLNAQMETDIDACMAAAGQDYLGEGAGPPEGWTEGQIAAYSDALLGDPSNADDGCLGVGMAAYLASVSEVDQTLEDAYAPPAGAGSLSANSAETAEWATCMSGKGWSFGSPDDASAAAQAAWDNVEDLPEEVGELGGEDLSDEEEQQVADEIAEVSAASAQAEDQARQIEADSAACQTETGYPEEVVSDVDSALQDIYDQTP